MIRELLTRGLLFLKTKDTVQVQDESMTIEMVNLYEGKTNAYIVDRTDALLICDKTDRKLDGRWEDDWVEISPGIETKHENKVIRTGADNARFERAIKGIIRIRRSACPVYIKYSSTHEYVDYDDNEFSSLHCTIYWVRYTK
jgi:hypothetical protein